MKKDRNSFFQEYGVNAYNTNMPIPNMGMNQFPMGQVQSNSSFYSGPAINPVNDNYSNELESRISKIERQINRLDARINKLEGEMPTNFNNYKPSDDTNYSNSSMYMV